MQREIFRVYENLLKHFLAEVHLCQLYFQSRTAHLVICSIHISCINVTTKDLSDVG